MHGTACPRARGIAGRGLGVMGSVVGSFHQGSGGQGSFSSPGAVDIPRVQPGSSCCLQTLSGLSHRLPMSEIATWPRSKHLPRPSLPHLPIPAATGAVGNSLHPFTDNTSSPASAASTPRAAPNLPVRKNTSRLGFLYPSLPSLPLGRAELLYRCAQGNHDLHCLLSPLAPRP